MNYKQGTAAHSAPCSITDTMTDTTLPLLIEPITLEARLGEPGLLLVDLSRADVHAQYHIPGAVPLEYGHIVSMQRPVGGLLPEAAQLSQVLSSIGLTPERHVVAYDDEGGGKAARLLWTLEVIGHQRYSLLNGGLHAWANEGHTLTREPTAVTPSHYQARIEADSPALADAEYILNHLGTADVALLDVRSPQEYQGELRYATRAGHIPGAVNFEWTEAMDQQRNLRLLRPEVLRQRLAQLGIKDGQNVVAYCQTHHRSAHSWFMLKWLGYAARGYPGSWSDWGNRNDTPVE